MVKGFLERAGCAHSKFKKITLFLFDSIGMELATPQNGHATDTAQIRFIIFHLDPTITHFQPGILALLFLTDHPMRFIANHSVKRNTLDQIYPNPVLQINIQQPMLSRHHIFTRSLQVVCIANLHQSNKLPKRLMDMSQSFWMHVA